MSDYICLELQREIIKRVPIKSLLRFRSVSKPWKSLIDSSDFIAAYTTHHHHLLIRYEDPEEGKEKYVSFVDDETFPQQKFVPTVPHLVQILQRSIIIGTSHGLLCLYGHYLQPDNSEKEVVVLWNPSIRKSVAIDVPDVRYGSYETVLGFGVCPVTSDPMIVKITQQNRWPDDEWIETPIPWQVEVYTLSSGEWRSLSTNLPHKIIYLAWSQVVVNRFIYWHASDEFDSEMIMCFDMTTYEFREVDLPDKLAHQQSVPFPHGMVSMSISKVWESLAVLEYNREVGIELCTIWMMENDTPTSYTKWFTFKLPNLLIMTLGFRKSGEPVIETLVDDESYVPSRSLLLLYEHHSEQANDLGFCGTHERFFVNFYTESLLLLNQSDTMTTFPAVELALQ